MLSKLHLAVIEDLKSRVTYSVLLQKLAPDDAIEFILRQLDKVVSLSLFRHRANGRRRRTTSDHTTPTSHFSKERGNYPDFLRPQSGRRLRRQFESQHSNAKQAESSQLNTRRKNATARRMLLVTAARLMVAETDKVEHSHFRQSLAPVHRYRSRLHALAV